jgi:hypothetical protein
MKTSWIIVLAIFLIALFLLGLLAGVLLERRKHRVRDVPFFRPVGKPKGTVLVDPKPHVRTAVFRSGFRRGNSTAELEEMD